MTDLAEIIAECNHWLATGGDEESVYPPVEAIRNILALASGINDPQSDVMKVRYEMDLAGPDIVGSIVEDVGRPIDIETQRRIDLYDDYDAVSVASLWGWTPDVYVNNKEPEFDNANPYRPNKWDADRASCTHRDTDGQEDCPSCGAGVEDFFDSAQDFLRDVSNDERTTPVYFAGTQNGVKIRKGEIELHFSDVYGSSHPKKSGR